MFRYNFESSVGYWITLTSHQYQQALNDELAPYGITFRQFQVLAWLEHEGPLTQTELSRRMMVEPPTLVGILDRMQRQGWLQRRSCKDDRRKKQITLCSAAAAVWSQIVDCLTRVREQATAGMTDEEVGMLKQLLAKVKHNLDQSTPTTAAAPTVEATP